MLFVGDISTWLPAYGAVLFLALVAKFTKAETRSLLLGLLLVTLAPSPSSAVVAAVLALVLRALDVVHIGR